MYNGSTMASRMGKIICGFRGASGLEAEGFATLAGLFSTCLFQEVERWH